MAFDGVVPAGNVKPAPYGLFSVADVVERGPRDEHWGNGFSAMSEACTFTSRIVDVCGAVAPVDVFVKAGERFKSVKPFGILTLDECLSVGYDAEDRRARVVRQLEIVTEKAVETELWVGNYRRAWNLDDPDPDEPDTYLSQSTTDVVEGTAQKPTVALALLEQALADCGPGYQGVIHLSPLTASVLGNHLHEEDGKLLTNSGNLVAVGSGYDGRGPGDSAAPADKFVHWMYATGPVRVVLGSKELITVNPAQATNVKTNEMTYAAERPAAVYTDGCCQLGAKADIRL